MDDRPATAKGALEKFHSYDEVDMQATGPVSAVAQPNANHNGQNPVTVSVPVATLTADNNNGARLITGPLALAAEAAV